MKRYPPFVILLLFFFSATKAECQTSVEIRIYNSLIDSLYQLKTCFQIIEPPYYRCCETDSLQPAERINCCKNSNIPPAYRVDCYQCANRRDVDTSDLIMVVPDSFSVLDVRIARKFLLPETDRSSPFYAFINKMKKDVPAHPLPADSIRQGRIRFVSATAYGKKEPHSRFGKSGNQIILGYMYLSGIYVDQEKGMGLLRVIWLGGPSCGNEKYYLLHKNGDDWRIYKSFVKGVF